MFGFPLPLFDSTTSAIKLAPVANGGFPKLGPSQTFYSIKTGSWSDNSIWQTASGVVGLTPTANDDVYIRHTITIDANSQNTTLNVNNLYVSGSLAIAVNNTTLVVNGNLVVSPFGLVDMTSSLGSTSLKLLGYDNVCAKSCFTASATATVNVWYAGTLSQNVLDLNYGGLSIGVQNIFTLTKFVQADLVVSGNLVINGSLELSSYNLTVNGTASLSSYINTNTITSSSPSALKKSASGSILFVGLVTFQNSCNTIDFSDGNPTVEFRGGISVTNIKNNFQFKTGTGTWSFTTNNQTLQNNSGGASTLYFDCPIIIDNNITLTLNDSAGTSTNKLDLVLNNTSGINGSNAGSTLLSYSTIVIPSSSTVLMSTGTFNASANAISNIAYTFNGSYTLPFTSYAGLIFGYLSVNPTGQKTLGGTTTVERLTVRTTGDGVLQLSTYDLTINDTCLLTGTSMTAGYYTMMKSGSGNILIKGLLTLQNGATNFLDLSAGNPTVELRGGITHFNTGASTTFKTGTGTWSFTTNNQTIGTSGGNVNLASNLTFDCPISIANGIVLSLQYYTLNAGQTTFNNTIDGGNSSSKLLISVAGGTYKSNSSTRPMATNGILDASTNSNTWIYGNSNQDILGGPDTSHKQVYYNLTLNGGGTKTLQGYVSVTNTYTLTAPATLNNNGFTLTNP